MTAVAHGAGSTTLSSPLVVSFASYGPRFPGLAEAARSLLSQTIKADATVLWVDEEEADIVPANVRALAEEGLVIRQVKGRLRSYKKIIPALREFPDAFIATADDDIVYRPDWLRSLVAGTTEGEVTCTRAHEIRLWPWGHPLPYRRWQHEVGIGVSEMRVATGVGGVLYRPGILDPEVLNQDVFKEICATGDDLWLYWMARLNGAAVRKVGPPFVHAYVPGSQDVSLYRHNVLDSDMNDRQVRAMTKRYGRVW